MSTISNPSSPSLFSSLPSPPSTSLIHEETTCLVPEYEPGFPCSNSIITATSLLSPEEYNKQGAEYTKRELELAGLYQKHVFHMYKMRTVDALCRALTHKVTLVLLPIFLAVIMCWLLGSGVHNINENVQPLSLPAKVSGVVVELFAHVKNAMTLNYQPELLLTKGECSNNTTSSSSSSSNKDEGQESDTWSFFASSSKTENNDKLKDKDKDKEKQGKLETAPLPTVNEHGFSSFLHNQTEKGRNIFSFALEFAREFAVTVFETLGWRETISE